MDAPVPAESRSLGGPVLIVRTGVFWAQALLAPEASVGHVTLPVVFHSSLLEVCSYCSGLECGNPPSAGATFKTTSVVQLVYKSGFAPARFLSWADLVYTALAKVWYGHRSSKALVYTGV